MQLELPTTLIKQICAAFFIDQPPPVAHKIYREIEINRFVRGVGDQPDVGRVGLIRDLCNGEFQFTFRLTRRNARTRIGEKFNHGRTLFRFKVTPRTARKAERQRDGETERQRDGETERRRDGERECGRVGERERRRDSETGKRR